MLRIFASTSVGLMLVASTAAAVSQPPQSQSAALPLLEGAQVVAMGAVAASSSDPDQGDDHAAAIAILTVCSHNNPSAQRSAICPQPNSPP
jgi:hypothetical protein